MFENILNNREKVCIYIPVNSSHKNDNVIVYCRTKKLLKSSEDWRKKILRKNMKIKQY